MKITDNPYPRDPKSEEMRLNEVRVRIENSAQIPADLKEELKRNAWEFLDLQAEPASEGTNFYGGQLGWTRCVIRNDHLNLVVALASPASAIATYATAVTGANPIALAVTLIFAMAAVGRTLLAKHAKLSEVEYGVLMALKHYRSASPEEIAKMLNGIRIYGLDMWDGKRVLEVLNKLKAIRLADGTVEELVVQAADGRWSTNGV